jgi:hydroxypyruvate reductase
LISSPNSPPGPNPVTFINPVFRQHLGSITAAALSAVDPRRVTARALDELASSLGADHVRAVAAGKAAVGMAAALDAALGPRLLRGVMTAAADLAPNPRWTAFAASHPRPNDQSEAAGRAALALADAARREHAPLLVCLSGGASAMLAVPADGLTIADKGRATDQLLKAGLDIGRLNLIRRHLSAIKGGQLAARAERTLTLAISDVCTPVDDDPAVIASGPTWGDDTTFADALRIVDESGLAATLPPGVVAHLRRGAAGEVAGPVPSGDPRLRQASYWVIASRHDAMRAAAVVAARLGYHVHVEPAAVVGEASRAGPRLIAAARDSLTRPACLISSGETTVRVTGRGRGGRNQELALASIEALAAAGPAALASIGSDGVDGPTDAAGAFVDDTLWARLGAEAAARVGASLADNDAYPLLESLDALVRTGPTGTNVGDLQVVLLGTE